MPLSLLACENGLVSAEHLKRGIACFNRGEFFDAHEHLEDAWRACSPKQKLFYQGLVQVAVAFHHHSTGNRVGSRSVLLRAMKNLRGHSGQTDGIELQNLLKSLGEWQDAVDRDLPLPALPTMKQR